jgi:hypothetical protein
MLSTVKSLNEQLKIAKCVGCVINVLAVVLSTFPIRMALSISLRKKAVIVVGV